jgi:hypothetical protein
MGDFMKSVTKMIAGLGIVVAAGLGFAVTQGHNLCDGFVPANTVNLPVGYKAPVGWKSNVRFDVGIAPAGGLTEKQFNDVMDRMEKLYNDEIKQMGGTLKINRNWTDGTVNASAQRFGTTWVLNMYGGLARHPEITMEGMALVVCHEMGHHRGGAPKVAGWFGKTDWASNEGAADYYATLKCLRRYFAEDDNTTIIAGAQVDPFAQAQCKAQFTNDKDVLLCERSVLAGQSVAGLFMDLRKEKTRPAFNTPDKNEVKVTDDNHPATQCRMDTYFSGASCSVDVAVANSDTDFKQGSCVQGVDTIGWRPRCWFKPTDAPAPAPKKEDPKPGNGNGNDDGNNGATAYL